MIIVGDRLSQLVDIYCLLLPSHPHIYLDHPLPSQSTSSRRIGQSLIFAADCKHERQLSTRGRSTDEFSESAQG